MEKSTALAYRQNTGNRGYGFNPVLVGNKKEADEYQFRGVHGNRRY